MNAGASLSAAQRIARQPHTHTETERRCTVCVCVCECVTKVRYILWINLKLIESIRLDTLLVILFYVIRRFGHTGNMQEERERARAHTQSTSGEGTAAAAAAASAAANRRDRAPNKN